MSIAEEKQGGSRTLCWTLYWVTLVNFLLSLLFSANYLMVFVTLGVLIASAVSKKGAVGTIYASHLQNIFSVSLFGVIAGAAVMIITMLTVLAAPIFFPILLLIWIAILIWFLYRIVRGMLFLNDGKAMWSGAKINAENISSSITAAMTSATSFAGAKSSESRQDAPFSARTEKEVLLEKCMQVVAPNRSPKVIEDPTDDVFHVIFSPIKGSDPGGVRSEVARIVETTQGGGNSDCLQIDFASKDRRDFIERELRIIFQDASIAVTGLDHSGRSIRHRFPTLRRV